MLHYSSHRVRRSAEGQKLHWQRRPADVSFTPNICRHLGHASSSAWCQQLPERHSCQGLQLFPAPDIVWTDRWPEPAFVAIKGAWTLAVKSALPCKLSIEIWRYGPSAGIGKRRELSWRVSPAAVEAFMRKLRAGQRNHALRTCRSHTYQSRAQPRELPTEAILALHPRPALRPSLDAQWYFAATDREPLRDQLWGVR